MIGPAVRRLVDDLKKVKRRSDYEDALLEELGPLLAATWPKADELQREHVSTGGSAELRVSMLTIEPSDYPSYRVVAEMLVAGGGPRGDMDERDIVRIHCDNPNCPNKRL